MVAVREITWEEASAPGFETTTRQVWRVAVAEVAERAKAKLPECSGRVDSAVKLVLAGDVTLEADGTAIVGSQSNGSTLYHVGSGTCSCKDVAKAPHGFCKHRLAVGITRRAQELVKAQRDGTHNDQGEASSLPAPAAGVVQLPPLSASRPPRAYQPNMSSSSRGSPL